jgi:hypothetical protein
MIDCDLERVRAALLRGTPLFHLWNLFVDSSGHARIRGLFDDRYTACGTSRHSYYRSSYETSAGNEISWALGFVTIACFAQAFRLDRKLRTLDSGDVSRWAWWQFLWFW